MENEKVYFIQIYFVDNPKIQRYLQNLITQLTEFVKIKSTTDTENFVNDPDNENKIIKVFKLAFVITQEYENYDMLSHISNYLSRIIFNQNKYILSSIIIETDKRLINYYDNQFLQSFVESIV